MTKVDTLIINACVLTSDINFTEYKNGFLAVKAGRIHNVGNMADLPDYDAETIIDTGRKLLIPGLVNSHAHAAMTVFRGIADDIALHDWLMKYIFPVEAKCVTPDLVLKGTRLAVLEMISSGTTTFNDMYYFSDEIAQAAKEIGIRIFISEGLVDFKSPNAKTPDEAFVYMDFLREKYANDDFVNLAVASHAPYTCSPELLQRADDYAQAYGLKHHIHVAETEWEYHKYKRENGKTPVEYLDNLGIVSEKLIAAHGVWLSDRDIDILKERKAGVAHNPECNMKISSGAARIPELLKFGVKVGLGTDGPASNNNLDMMQEMHSMALLHKFVSKDPTVIPAREALRIATMGGAELLGIENEIGSIEIGKKADFVLLDSSGYSGTPVYDPYSAIVYALSSNAVTDVFINGNHVYQNKNFPNCDTEQIKAHVRETAERVKLKIVDTAADES